MRVKYRVSRQIFRSQYITFIFFYIRWLIYIIYIYCVDIAETVQLTVVTQTTIDKGPETTQTKKIHEDVTLDCSVLYDPTFSLTVEWKKDNVEVEIDDERITIDRASVGNQALTIRDITYNDAGKILAINILSRYRLKRTY